MAQTTVDKLKAWSFKAGKKGKNRVRAYEDEGQLLMEWQTPVFDKEGKAVIDPGTGKQLTRRERVSLTAEGITSYEDAMVKAIQSAKEFDKLIAAHPPDDDADKPREPVTLKQVIDRFMTERSPMCVPDTQRQHRCHRKLLFLFFGADAVVERIDRHGRPCTSMGRVRFNDYVKARKSGQIPGYRRVENQTILNEVRFMKSVFNHAKLEQDDGTIMLLRNPWDGLLAPPEDKPTREPMTEELHERICQGAPNWRMAELLAIMRETRHRMNSVRQLSLEDVDVEAGTVRWLGEFDKAKQTRVNPLTRAALEAIMRVLEHRQAEGVSGSRWLFPAPRNPGKPVSKHTLHEWMRATKKRLGIKTPRLGYHGEKRAGIRAPAFKQLPIEVREELAGTTWETMKRVYDDVDLPQQRAAIAFLDGEVDRLPVSHRELDRFRKAA